MINYLKEELSSFSSSLSIIDYIDNLSILLKHIFVLLHKSLCIDSIRYANMQFNVNLSWVIFYFFHLYHIYVPACKPFFFLLLFRLINSIPWMKMYENYINAKISHSIENTNLLAKFFFSLFIVSLKGLQSCQITNFYSYLLGIFLPFTFPH